MRAKKATPESPIQPRDTGEAAAKESKPEVDTYKHDYGPLRTYEITWADGRTETVQGHSVQFDSIYDIFGRERKPRFAVRGEFDGHWRYVLGGFADDVKLVRDVTASGQAVLPKALAARVIGSMETGQTGYAVPWAMLADMDGKLWLKPEYDLRAEPAGTCQMRVELRADGYHVTPAPGNTYQNERRWQKNLRPVAVLEEGKSE